MSIHCVTDVDLVIRARQGDSAAFGELVDRHRAAVYRTALAALRSPADAEDVAQDAFLLAYRRLDSFRGNASFKTWLLSITWHQAINRRRSLTSVWRRMVASPAGDDNEPAIARVASDGPSPEEAAEAEQLRRGVRDAIRALSSTLRDALLLALADDYTYEEIGVIVGAPVGTIKWRVSEARRLVKKQLKARGFSDDR